MKERECLVSSAVKGTQSINFLSKLAKITGGALGVLL
jgi:hypothetical protein